MLYHIRLAFQSGHAASHVHLEFLGPDFRFRQPGANFFFDFRFRRRRARFRPGWFWPGCPKDRAQPAAVPWPTFP
jgi:hypothetical protein